jgi:hypothetical protein
MPLVLQEPSGSKTNGSAKGAMTKEAMPKEAQEKPAGQGAADVLKGWTMVALTFVFVLFYGAALFGWLKPLNDVTMITRLEPIIFVIIGYYFGRLPAQQNEKTLKDEIGRQTQKADAAQHAKEQAQQTREGLEEKVKNVNAALTSATPAASATRFADDVHKVGGPINEDGLRHSVGAALRILNS